MAQLACVYSIACPSSTFHVHAGYLNRIQKVVVLPDPEEEERRKRGEEPKDRKDKKEKKTRCKPSWVSGASMINLDPHLDVDLDPYLDFFTELEHKADLSIVHSLCLKGMGRPRQEDHREACWWFRSRGCRTLTGQACCVCKGCVLGLFSSPV